MDLSLLPYSKWKTIVYPLTIVKDRYSGVYSGEKYLAFKLEPNGVPEQVWANDMACGDFWELEEAGLLSIVIGKGSTPELAIEDLHKKLKMRLKSDANA